MKGPIVGERSPLTPGQRKALAKRNSRLWSSGYFAINLPVCTPNQVRGGRRGVHP
jgi:hypothetical protein